MVLTVVSPPIGAFIGAGYSFHFHTDIVGPLPSTAQFLATVDALPQFTTVLQQLSPLNLQHDWSGWWYVSQRDVQELTTPQYGAAFGADLNLQLQLVDTSNGNFLEPPTNFQTFAWDSTGALPILLQKTGTSGTFTDADRALLSEIYDSTSTKTYSTLLTHTDLVDNGVILTNISTRALRVTVTAFPDNVIVDHGSPEYFFNLGFITINRASGFVRSARLVFEHQLYPVTADTLAFGYTLRNGTVVNVEELVPAT